MKNSKLFEMPMEMDEIPPPKIDAVICDVCRTAYYNELEIEEFISIDHEGNYVSVFEDRDKIACDICQYCFRDLLSK